MSTTSKPALTTPTSATNGSHGSEAAHTSELDRDVRSSAAIALSMSWQLLFVMVLPILAGLFVDNKFDSAPVAALVGIGVGILGTVVIVWRTVKEVNYMFTHDRSSK